MFQLGLRKILRTQRGRLNNLAILLITNVFTAGVGFITTITIANTLGSTQFGKMAYALAIGGILAVNVRFGMDRSLIRDLTHFPDRFNEILVASILARGMLFILCTMGLLILMILPIKSLELSWPMFTIILSTAMMPMQLANVFDIWECQGRHAFYNCIQRTIYFIIIWAVVFVNPCHFSLLWIGSALLASTLVFLLLQYHYVWKKLSTTWLNVAPTQTLTTAISLLFSNKWLWFTSLGSLGIIALNNLVLKQVAGFAELGVFFASFQIAAIGTLCTKNLARIGKPVLAKKLIPGRTKKKDLQRFLLIYLLILLTVTSGIALPMILLPRTILNIVFTSEYVNSGLTLQLFGIYLFIQAIATVYNQFLIYSRKDKTLFIANIAAGIFSVLSCFLLIPRYHSTGAAGAILIGIIVGTTISILSSWYLLRNERNVTG